MRKNILALVFAVALLATAGVWLVGSASADDTTCIGTIGGTHDNVVVPPGASCVLATGTVVTGDVKVESGAFFGTFFGCTAPPCATISGSVQAQKARIVSIVCSTVNGDVQVQDSGPSGAGSAFTRITGSTVGGNIQIEKQSGGAIVVGPSAPAHPCEVAAGAPLGNTVGGDVQIKDNTTPFSPSVGLNIVGGNLQCEKNAPGPVSSGFSAVSGSKEGQCTAGAGF